MSAEINKLKNHISYEIIGKDSEDTLRLINACEMIRAMKIDDGESGFEILLEIKELLNSSEDALLNCNIEYFLEKDAKNIMQSILLSGQKKLEKYYGKFIDNRDLVNYVLKEYCCAKVFKDHYNSVMVNLETFNDAYHNKVFLDNEKYKKLEEFFNLLNSREEIILSTDLNKFKGLKELLYDAFKEMQENSFEDLKKSLYKFEEADIDKKLSEETGVKIYNIGKQQKNFLMHVTRIERRGVKEKFGELAKEPEFDFMGIFSQRKRKQFLNDYISASYVDNSNLKTFRNLKDYVAVVFGDDIPNNNLIAISNKDAYIDDDGTKEGVLVSKQKHCYLNSESLKNKSLNFNEVAFLRKNIYEEDAKTNLPIAIFCLGEITELEIKYAKQSNIPIVFSQAKYNYKTSNSPLIRLENSDHLEELSL